MQITKVLFIQKEFENIGIEYLSANPKKNNHQVDLVFFPFPISDIKENKIISQKISEYKPDIIAFSPFTSHYQWSLSKSRYIKSKYSAIFTLFGGVHVNSVPEMVIKEKPIDGIIIGEADENIVTFANTFKTDYTKTPSLWYKNKHKIYKNPLSKLIEDLDKLPFPDKELFYSKMPSGLTSLPYTAMGSRGCPFACTYCSNNIYQKLYLGQKRLRYRDPAKIVDEISTAKNKYHFKRVEFSDDVLAVDLKRLAKLTRLYKRKVNLPFACFFHPQLVNKKTITYLKQGGCDWLKLGLQSANEEYRHKYLNRHETNLQVLKVSQLCHQLKLGFSFDHIFNLPFETSQDLIEAVSFYNQCRPSIVNFGGLMYLPKADIIKHGLASGDIQKKDLPAINNGSHKLSRQYNVPWYSYKQADKTTNTSIFMLLFILITLLPQKIISLLMKLQVYRFPFPVPNYIIVPLKIISKLVSGQIYLYKDGIRQRIIQFLASFQTI